MDPHQEQLDCRGHRHVWRMVIKTKTNTLERPVDKLCLICEMDTSDYQKKERGKCKKKRKKRTRNVIL